MISAKEAIRIVLTNKIDLGTEEINITDAVGRTLEENIIADRDFPPFDRVAMDGIAINFKEWESGRRSFNIEGTQMAGSPQKVLSDATNCFEVMTGSMLPLKADLVIRYEDLIIKENVAHVQVDSVKLFQSVHLKGSDRKKGEVLIQRGKVLSPAEIAVVGTVGKPMVKVKAKIKVAIVSTGDELVDVDEAPEPYQIRMSNVYALQAAFLNSGVLARRYHIKDEEDLLNAQLSQILAQYDAVILSGGVSKGKKDYVPEVLKSLGVQMLFHGVKQRPGKPFWFGKREDARKTAVFALPGNPVSAFMCFYRYIIPWLNKCYDRNGLEQSAILTADFEFSPDLTYYLQVKISEQAGKLMATPVAGKGSGDLANLLEADAFIELPADRSKFEKGESFPVFSYRS